MGYNNERYAALCIDIESVAKDGIAAIVDPPTAPSNYRDEVKIAAKKQEKLEAEIANAALNPLLNRIVAFGVWAPNYCHVFLARNEDEEKKMLESVAALMEPGTTRLVTFNGHAFDIPTIKTRVRRLGVPFPYIDIDPSWRSPHTDLMNVMTYQGRFAKKSLDFYCRCEDVVVEDDRITDEMKAVTGADIHQLVLDNRWDLIGGHCRYDVLKTAGLAQKVGVL